MHPNSASGTMAHAGRSPQLRIYAVVAMLLLGAATVSATALNVTLSETETVSNGPSTSQARLLPFTQQRAWNSPGQLSWIIGARLQAPWPDSASIASIPTHNPSTMKPDPLP